MVALLQPQDAFTPQGRSILLSSQSNEWYTPSIYVEAARQIMGRIDLDPASCELANELVRADNFYSKESNGLAQEWYGCIWLNPPYGTTHNRSNAGLWIKRTIAEYRQGTIEQAMLLVNAHTDARWFHQLFAYPICFTEGRINFFAPHHRTDTGFSRTTTGMTHGSAFAYLGPNEQKFINIFSQFGTIARRVSPVPVQEQPHTLWEVQP